MRKLSLFIWIGLVAVAAAADLNLPREETALPEHKPFMPGPGDRIIARLVAELLEESHYSQRQFDDTVSSEFLDRYIDMLDPQHLHFLQSDIDEFQMYRTTLDDMIKKRGDTSAGYYIAEVFLTRVDQRMTYCENLLTNETFKFDTNDKVMVDRKDEPFPKDLAAARRIWRNRLRAELLQEEINQIKPTNQLAKADQKAGGSSDTTIFVDVPSSLPWSTTSSGTGTATSPASTTTFQWVSHTNFVLHGFAPSTLGLPSSTHVFSPDDLSAEQSNKVAGMLWTLKPNWVVKATTPGLASDSSSSTNKAETPIQIITRRYNRVWRLYREWDNEDVLEVFLTSLARTYDPHSDYFGKSQLENFSIGMSLSLFGIGARLTSEDGYCTIVDLTDGGPAKRSGKLKPKDRIVAVAQGDAEPVDVVDMKLNKIVEMIRGPKGTEVRLTIIPVDATDPSARKVVSIVREEIKLADQAAKAELMELPGEDGKKVRLGVIDLPSFYATFNVGSRFDPDNKNEQRTEKSTSADVAKLLKKLEDEHVQGVILDLRRNGGGSLEEAVKLTGLFIKSGPVVQVRDPDPDKPPIVDEDNNDSIAYDGPLVVLTSHFSASASEIFAGALQDYGRAVIVGDSSTHGKGTVQALHQLDIYYRHIARQLGLNLTNNPGALKLTIRKFYRASGASTQLKGVIPDIVLPSVVDAIDVSEKSLDNPLPYDTIAPAKFTPVNMVTPYLNRLKALSAHRVATEKDFAYIREDYELARKNRDDKTASLNLAERLKEKEETEARRQARIAERRSRPKTPETDYEITLKQADEPGLPPPVGATNELAAGSTQVQSGASTNAASVRAAMPVGHPSLSSSDEEDEEDSIDVPLEEAKHVLLDYLSLLAGNPIPIATSSTANATANAETP